MKALGEDAPVIAPSTPPKKTARAIPQSKRRAGRVLLSQTSYSVVFKPLSAVDNSLGFAQRLGFHAGFHSRKLLEAILAQQNRQLSLCPSAFSLERFHK